MKTKEHPLAENSRHVKSSAGRTVKDAPVGLVRLDEAALVLKANRYMADLLGVEDGSLRGASLFRFLTDTSRTTFRYYLEELLVSGENQLCELTFMKNDGSRVRTIIRSSLTKKKNGALIDAAVTDLANSSGNIAALPDESLRNFADNVPDAIFRLDRNLRHVFVNSVMTEMTGMSRDDLLESSLDDWDFLRNDAVALVKGSVRKALKTLAPQEIEIVNDHAGSPAYFNVRLIPETDNEGEARTILGVMRDLTAQKRNEQVVQAEHSFREAVGRSLSIGIGAIDDHGRQIYVNPAFCRIVGWSREELLGMHFPYVYWPHSEIRKALRIFVGVRREKKPSGSFEVTLARRDGTRFDALIMYSAFYDNSGRRIGWIGSVGDISGLKRKEAELQRLNRDLDAMVRKRTESLRMQNQNLRDILMGLNRAQEELRLSETRVLLEKQRLETMLNVVPAGVVVVEGREGQIAFINRIAQGLFGYEPQPADIVDNLHTRIRRPDGEPYPPEELPLNRSLLNGETVRGEEMAIVRPGDDQAIPVLANTTPFVIHGEIVGAVGSFIDISKVKRSEESIRTLNTELAKNLLLVEDTNKELESFVHSVTHDVRSPLVVINGFSRRLLELPPEGFEEKSKEYIEYIQETSQNALFLVRDLLRLFKIARGEIKRVTVDIAQMALSLQHYFQGLYPGRAVRMVTDGVVHVSGDYNLLKIVMENLVGNAYKFTAKNDGETVIKVGSYESKDDRVIYVRDNGCGFDMARAGRLFQPFVRFHDENEYKGTGIGLATVKRIIHRHGGRIWAESQPGRGATFYFTLPE